MDRDCFISNLIKSVISMELAETQSMALIAKHLNVSSNAVSRQLRKYGDGLRNNYDYLPQHISMDEFKSVKNVSGAMILIFIDARNHEVIDIVENRQQGYLRDYFLRYSLKARLQVRTVTIDMYLPYIQVIKDCFPNARMIIDRFHIVQLLNRALNQIRIQEMKKIRYSRPTDYTKLKKTMEAAPQKWIGARLSSLFHASSVWGHGQWVCHDGVFTEYQSAPGQSLPHCEPFEMGIGQPTVWLLPDNPEGRQKRDIPG